MRKILILIVLTIVTLCSCTKKSKQLEGVWNVDRVSFPIEVELLDSDIDKINKEINGLKYEFRNDTMFIADTLAGFYTKTDSTISLQLAFGGIETYDYALRNDSLIISNKYFTMSMKHNDN